MTHAEDRIASKQARMRVDLSIIVDVPEDITEAEMEARAQDIGFDLAAEACGEVGVEDWYLLMHGEPT